VNAAVLSACVAALGWGLLQFVWQAAVVGVVYAVARWLLPRGNPRYLAAVLALLALAVWPAVTVWHGLATGLSTVSLPDEVVTSVAQSVVGSPVVATSGWRVWVNAAVPWLVLAWALGVAVLGTRVFRQWRGLRAMLRAAEALPAWQARARRFADGLGLRRMVPVLASVRVVTPTLVGWLRPAVVLPLAVLARMPVAQIDLILAHELAHLKRLDHIANLFQVVLETLFFYHPVVHWISRDARNERELCCDAMALRVTRGQRRDFVAALANLEEFRAGRGELALAASGGVLVERAWFIAGTTAMARPRRYPRGQVCAALVAAAVVALGWTGWQHVAWQQQTAAMIATNDASVARVLWQDAMPLQWLPLPMQTKQPLLPVASAAAVAPAVELKPPVSAGVLDTPGLRLPALPLRLAPVTAALPLRASAVATADASATPHAVHTVRPVYPAAELLAGTQAQVVVEFSLDVHGVPHDVEVAGASAGPFVVAALQALQQWRFAPPAVSGRRYRQAFSFLLGAGAGNSPAAAHACLVTTGTHICRPVTDASAGVTLLKPLH
jgi:TonB family protein